ncbi:tripartite tricarboxylate transporter substrate binding protein [Belnapia sp. T18]|uniref:Tripartite tricarboxylate transporter substrate binding protein n=1 Tax=Belnapia arida TaxID=2804533 RepID=A0ABS1UCY7_9PROT|nr:tripartite tricarboxylate transporter substrate binding protein [Belnapia arida]MBL6082514.1 tripartite tricarboxylate transporter substrate binding protein [Belnapia arida]
MLSRRALLAALLAVPTAVRAQGSWPARSVTVVVPWAAGGSTDFLARVLCQRLSADLGQPFVVENRPGAAGTVGHAAVSRARPDGHTLLIGANGTYAMAPHLYDNLGYDTLTGFTPVGLLARTPIFFGANPRLVPGGMTEFIARAKAEPGKVAYASSGAGSSAHLAAELLAIMAGVELLHVPYRGGGPAAQALVAGEVAMGPTDAPTALPLMRGGQIKALGVGNPARTAQAADVPTVAETLPKLAGFECAAEFCMLAPPGTPTEIISRLHGAVLTALRHPEVIGHLNEGAMEPVGAAPDAWEPYLRRELEKWGGVIRTRGIRVG